MITCPLLREADVFHVQAKRWRDARAGHVGVHQIVQRFEMHEDERRILGGDRADLPIEVLPLGFVIAGRCLVDQGIDVLVGIVSRVDRAARLKSQ